MHANHEGDGFYITHFLYVLIGTLLRAVSDNEKYEDAFRVFISK
jgi:hypothetical protein